LLNGCELQIGAKSIDPRKLEICLLSRGSQVQILPGANQS